MPVLSLSDRLPSVSLGDTTVPQEGELSLSQWVQWSQGLPVTSEIESQLMAIVHPSALLGIGKGFLSSLNPDECICNPNYAVANPACTAHQ